MTRIHHAAATFVSAILFLGLVACGEDDAPSAPGQTDTERLPNGAAGIQAETGLAETGKELVGAICTACHVELEDGGWSRMEEARRTPEGWDMTLVRMMNFHGLVLTRDERRSMVKYLADSRGLAPAETADYRYAIERQPNVVEAAALGDKHTDRMMETCARCHSMARVGLQRRSEDEWRKLAHMHAGQWPTIEYHMLSRDRQWWEEVNDWVVSDLAKAYPYSDPAWAEWEKRERRDLAGTWRYVSYIPGDGYTHGTLEFEGTAADEYRVSYNLTNGAGEALSGSFAGIIYTGYEWRGAGDMAGQTIRQVAALTEDASAMTGRWFRADRSEVGGSIHAVRADGDGAIMAVTTESFRQGTSAELVILGAGLSGDVDLGPGLTVTVTENSPQRIVAEVAVADDAEIGRRAVRVGSLNLDDAIAVYDRIGRVVVTPDYAVARVGGAGGAEPIESAQFEAIAMHAGPDGEAETDDDFRIGVVNASWATDNAHEGAEEMEDARFAGTISDTGMFTPGAAGPNPERTFSTNNSGDLKVIATVDDDGRTLTGEARLIATVQRWNNPPLY